jgi:hypothetical protein
VFYSPVDIEKYTIELLFPTRPEKLNVLIEKDHNHGFGQLSLACHSRLAHNVLYCNCKISRYYSMVIRLLKTAFRLTFGRRIAAGKNGKLILQRGSFLLPLLTIPLFGLHRLIKCRLFRNMLLVSPRYFYRLRPAVEHNAAVKDIRNDRQQM